MKRRYLVLILLFLASSVYLEFSKDKTDGSSYSFKPNGVRAFFLLLEKMQVPIEAWLYPFSELSLENRNQTLLIVNPKQISDSNRLLSWVGKGNRLIVFGEFAELWDKFSLLENSTSLKSRDPEAKRTLLCSENSRSTCLNVNKISGLANSFESYSAEAAEILVGTRAEGLLAKIEHQQGELWLFSSPEIISNEFIDRDDNLRLLFQIISDSEKILFDEFHHGYFAPTPEKNKQSFEAGIIFIAFFASILILAALSRAIRFGPALPEEEKNPALGTEFASVLGLLYHEHRAKVLDNYIQAWKTRAAKKHALSPHASTERIIEDLERKKIIAKGISVQLHSALRTLKYSEDNNNRQQAVNQLEEIIK